eukprot:scaffold213457_cov35-Tisochrysis_lutea.AAC.1
MESGGGDELVDDEKCFESVDQPPNRKGVARGQRVDGMCVCEERVGEEDQGGRGAGGEGIECEAGEKGEKECEGACHVGL